MPNLWARVLAASIKGQAPAGKNESSLHRMLVAILQNIVPTNTREKSLIRKYTESVRSI